MRIFERLFVIVLLLSSMGVVDSLTRPSYGENTLQAISAGVPLSTTIAESAVYLCGFLFVLMRWRRVASAARAAWPVVAFTALAPLSVIWSSQPRLTLQRSAFVLASTVLAIYIGERYSIEKLARLLAQSFCLMMLAVIALYFIAPAYVVDYVTHIGAWKGLSGHKNEFGGYMAIAVVLLVLVRFHHYRWLRYVFLVAAAFLLVLSHSMTAILGCVLAIAALPLWLSIRMKGPQRWATYSIAAVALSVALYLGITKAQFVLSMLGRDLTLSGRAQLWARLATAISKHPILGYGYGAFWAGLKGEALNVFIGSRWVPTAADNGYLDLCLGLGLLGLFAFVCLFVYSLRMAWHYVGSTAEPIGLWPIAYLCFFAVHAICESQLFTRRSFESLMFVAVTTSLALVHRQHHVTVLRPSFAQPVLTSDRHLAGEFSKAPSIHRSR